MTNKTKQYKLLTISAIMLLTSAVYSNAQIESARTNASQFETNMDVKELINEQSQEMALPQPEPQQNISEDIETWLNKDLVPVGGLDRFQVKRDIFREASACNIVDAVFIQRPTLEAAVKMLGPCMEELSTKYGLRIVADKHTWRTGTIETLKFIHGIGITVSGKEAVSSAIADRLEAAVKSRNNNILTHPARVVNRIELRTSSLQSVVDHCVLPADFAPPQNAEEFVMMFKKCFEEAPGFDIQGVYAVKSELSDKRVTVISKADRSTVYDMNGKVTVGTVDFKIRASKALQYQIR